MAARAIRHRKAGAILMLPGIKRLRGKSCQSRVIKLLGVWSHCKLSDSERQEEA